MSKKKSPSKKPVNHVTGTATLVELKPHPDNYRSHPEDQLAHIKASITEHGFYKNVVLARDNTILAGHGAVEAAKQLGLETIPAVKLDLEPTDHRALKIVAGDNEMGRLAVVDDRKLTEMLKSILEVDAEALLGTGYDEKMLAGLVFVTRNANEVETIDEAAHWVGMPEFDSGSKPFHQIILSFASEADWMKFRKLTSLDDKIQPKSRSSWWPYREREDLASVKFDQKKKPAAGKPKAKKKA